MLGSRDAHCHVLLVVWSQLDAKFTAACTDYVKYGKQYIYNSGASTRRDKGRAREMILHAIRCSCMQKRWQSVGAPLSYQSEGLLAGAADLGDILVGHDTWDSYSQMTKIYKRYDFALKLKGVRGASMALSSYPGKLAQPCMQLASFSRTVMLHMACYILPTPYPSVQAHQQAARLIFAGPAERITAI